MAIALPAISTEVSRHGLNRLKKTSCCLILQQASGELHAHPGGEPLGELSEGDDEIECALSALVTGTSGDYVRKCGFKTVLVGLSGGIDSAVVASIAAAAVGKDNVTGVAMPGPYSSEGSLRDARAGARNRAHTISGTADRRDLRQAIVILFAKPCAGGLKILPKRIW